MPTTSQAIFHSKLSGFPPPARGKVRDVYPIDNNYLLIVTTDRLSAFDVVLPTPIPGKGQVLTALSNFWFSRTRHIVPNHLTEIRVADIVTDEIQCSRVARQAVVVKRIQPLPIEVIVRGYLAGSAWQDYQRAGTICGLALSAGLKQAERLTEPLFTPSTKAVAGSRDENISFSQAVDLIGRDLAEQVRDISLHLYGECVAYAQSCGIIIADTKLEFGLDDDARLFLIDELLTPDSSRFWPAEHYAPGRSPPSYDKQFVRDYLEDIGWDKRPPAPALPEPIIAKTAEKYQEACHRLLGN